MTDFRERVDKILSVSMDKFGENVKFFPKSGGVFEVRGIFDNEYQSLDPDTEQVVSVNQPALGVNLNDLKFEVKQNDEVEIRGQRFRVQDKREDGQGGATLMLHKVMVYERDRDTRVR
jgi:hypothetical protein